MAHPHPIPSTGSGRRKSCPYTRAKPPVSSGQRQLSSGWKRNSRPVQRLPTPHPETTIKGLAGAQRSGPGGLLPPGASTWPRGPARLHPLQLPGSHHRRPALPPPAVPTGAEPFRCQWRQEYGPLGLSHTGPPVLRTGFEWKLYAKSRRSNGCHRSGAAAPATCRFPHLCRLKCVKSR